MSGGNAPESAILLKLKIKETEMNINSASESLEVSESKEGGVSGFERKDPSTNAGGE
jgi:hypothetical protein